MTYIIVCVIIYRLYMLKENIYKIVTRYWNRIKIFWIVIAIVVMLFAIKTYINYSMITEEIEKVNSDIGSLQQEIAYSEKFYSKYLDSDYSNYFLSHKNNILFDGEYIIMISEKLDDDNIDDNEFDTNEWIKSPQESWKDFIKSKLN